MCMPAELQAAAVQLPAVPAGEECHHGRQVQPREAAQSQVRVRCGRLLVSAFVCAGSNLGL